MTPNIQKSGSNLHGGDEMSQRLTERFFKRQEKSDFFQKDVKRLLTKPLRRGIFITLISTRHERVLTTPKGGSRDGSHRPQVSHLAGDH